MKKLFVLLFPQREYVKGYFSDQDVLMFNECINKRYIASGYEFCVATFKNSDLGIVNLQPDIVASADITFEESSPYTSKDWKYANFMQLAKSLDVDDYSSIVVGGFHCYDCVERLANEIYDINPNVIIDTDLTEMFRNSYLYEKDFDIKNFKPELKLRRVLEQDRVIPISTLEKQKEKYQNPIWGISSKFLGKIDSKIQEQIEHNNLSKGQ